MRWTRAAWLFEIQIYDGNSTPSLMRRIEPGISRFPDVQLDI